MLDNLQLLFVYAPVMNVQMILDGIFIGLFLRSPLTVWRWFGA